jgi:hypothetical protein
MLSLLSMVGGGGRPRLTETDPVSGGISPAGFVAGPSGNVPAFQKPGIYPNRFLNDNSSSFLMNNNCEVVATTIR